MASSSSAGAVSLGIERLLKRLGEQGIAWLLVLPAMVFIALVFVVPLARIGWISVSEPSLSLGNFRHLFSEELYYRVLGRTFAVALAVTTACLVIAYPIAYYAATRRGWLGKALLLAAVLSFWLSFLVRTYAWLVILGNRGPLIGFLEGIGVQSPRILFTTTATVIGMIHILLPFMVLALYAVMAKIDSNYPRAALSLGASPTRAFWMVYFPLSLPGVVNGCMLVFIFCLGFYVTPALLGGPRDLLIAGLIAFEIQEVLDWGIASAMAVVLLAVTASVLTLYDRLVGLDRLWG
ncbi:MAG: ABC transporter permease [Alphaproteobacteria bacterium]